MEKVRNKVMEWLEDLAITIMVTIIVRLFSLLFGEDIEYPNNDDVDALDGQR